MTFSDCCKEPILIEDSDICPKCNEHCTPQIICPECNGDGRVDYLDKYRIHSLTINPPYINKVCELCKGDGYVRV